MFYNCHQRIVFAAVVACSICKSENQNVFALSKNVHTLCSIEQAFLYKIFIQQIVILYQGLKIKVELSN